MAITYPGAIDTAVGTGTAGAKLSLGGPGGESHKVAHDDISNAIIQLETYQNPWKHYNAIRNPEMIVAQRGITFPAASGYCIDGWLVDYVGTMVAAIAQANASSLPADASGNNWYPHPANSQLITFTTAQASLSAAQYFYIQQKVEGNMASVLKNNPTSISMLVYSNISGTFTVSLRDSVVGYSCVNTGTTIAGQWNRVTIPNIPTFTASGNFPDGTGTCYNLGICLGCGTTFTTSTVGSWVAGNFLAATGQTNYAATAGNYFYFTLVQHEPNPVCTPYIKRELADEWALCQRYLIAFQFATAGYMGYCYNAVNFANLGYTRFDPMRAVPTLVAGATWTVNAGNAGTVQMTSATTTSCLFGNGSGNWTVGSAAGLNGFITAEL